MAEEFSDGEAYERFMGRWSRLVAPTFVAWLDASPGLRWLDVGCGTGALTSAILAGAAPALVLAVDPSPAFVAAARRDLAGRPAVVQVASADALPADDTSVDVVVSGLVLNFLPDVSAALREQVRTARPGGIVAAFVWDYAQGMQPLHLFWQAVAAVDPARADLDEAARFPICRPDALQAAWSAAGLGEVSHDAVVAHRRFASFDEVWTPFLGGQGPAGRYLAGLGTDHRARVADEFRARLPLADDGSVELTARAWAVRGTLRA